MSRLKEFLEDDDKQFSCYRLCFLAGVFGLFALAFLQFFGFGSIPTALYAILGTMASGGYLGGKYADSKYPTSETLLPDATEGDL